MTARNGAGRAFVAQMSTRMRVAAVLVIMATIALTLFAVSTAQSRTDAYAEVYVVPSSEEAANPSGNAADAQRDSHYNEWADDWSGDTGKGDAAKTEQIDDDDTPLASGVNAKKMGSSEGGLSIEMFIILGIVIVVAFFAVSIARLNLNMRKMNDSMRSKKDIE